MTDYGHDLLFGLMVRPSGLAPQRVIDLAMLADVLGLDLFSLPDHPYRTDELDSLALLAHLAGVTERVRLVPNLANLALRPPAMLARTAATVDVLSGGRFELGVAAGALWDEIETQGVPRRDGGAAVASVGEAIRLIRALWTPGAPVDFGGEHYTVDGAPPGPFPVHDIEIWNGAYRPRMLAATGRYADGWIPSSPGMPPSGLASANKMIDEAAVRAGRRPGQVRRLYNIAGRFTAGRHGFLDGPPAMWAEQLAELTLTEGISGYLLYLIESTEAIRTFATEVVPAVREVVGAARRRGAAVLSPSS